MILALAVELTLNCPKASMAGQMTYLW